MNIEEIKNKIEQVLLDTGLENVFPFRAEKLANMLGYDSYYFIPSDSTRHVSGAVEHDKKRILINKNDPVQRQLFTLAHEIGHIVLHKDKGNRIDFRSSIYHNSDPIIEDEANNFAGILLMPEEEFKEKWKLHTKNISLVAAYFGISEAAARMRAKKLGLL